MEKIKCAVLIGGPSAEHEVSLATGKFILAALDKEKYTINPVKISRAGKWSISLDNLKTDVAFIAMHGTYGEDGTVQGFLEATKVPYTGSGVLASALAMDKVRSSQLFTHGGLNVPKFVIKTDTKLDLDRINADIGFPCVVKPSRCGSSVGITIVHKPEALYNAVVSALKYDSVALVQQYIKGHEVTCAILEIDGKATPLQPTQIIPKTSDFFDYNAKYTPGASAEITPPNLPKPTIKKIQNIAIKAHEILGCRGMSRTDMIAVPRRSTRRRVSHDIYVLETNTIPGMTKTSLLPQAAAAAGISFPKLLDHLITSALKK